MTLKAVGDHLETTWLGEKMIMIPESETAFFEEDSDRTFRFVKDDKGATTSLVISVPEELVLRRVAFRSRVEALSATSRRRRR